MTKILSLKLLCQSLCYILLLAQTTSFYYKNINANQGSITINSAKDVNILASQNITNNHSAYNETNMMYSIHDNHDLQIATTVSPLLSSNNITISADNNINLLSSILVGQGNLNLTSTNGEINMQALQDLYYQYDFSQATSVDLGALIGVIVATIAIAVAAAAVTVFTLGAAGPAAIAGMAAAETGMIGALSAASVAGAAAGMTAITTATLTTAAVVASVGVGAGMAINAAIDSKNGGAAATKDMQSGHMDSTTKQYQATVGNSLLFGGDVNITHGVSGTTNIDRATQIDANNINQTAQTNESASFKEEHKTIGPDWNQLMTDAAINGVVSGVTVAAGPLIEAGVSKLGSFVSKSFGFTDDAAELAATTMTKDEIIQAGMNNITAEKPIAKAINNLSSTPEKALNSVDNTVDILGELGKKALPDPMNGMSKIVDKAMPDMSLAKDVGSLGKNVGSVLDAGVAEPFFKLPGSSPKSYIFDNPAVMAGAAVGGKIGGNVGEGIGRAIGLRFGIGEISGAAGRMTGTVIGAKIGVGITNNIINTGTQTTKNFTIEKLKNVNNLLKI